ncbi:hypothetical protein BSKO_07091 [Bryopsis sp. KO-2023]|nr:hypothetical protein BSKO_07091 [Bryopsis sp. KO-2023]
MGSLVAFLFLFCLVGAEQGAVERTTKVIAHRGSPCRYPEETMKGYEHAIEAGVDFIEMDVVSTKDGHLVTRHDIILDESTDVQDSGEFQDKKVTKLVDGKNMTGYFTIDFDLAEVKRLSAKQRFRFRDQSFDDSGLKVPTLPEILKLVKKARKNGKNVGAYIETKRPAFHLGEASGLEVLLVKDLKEAGMLDDPEAIFLQSFDKSSLQRLHDLLEKEGVQMNATWLLQCEKPPPTNKDLEDFAKIGSAIGSPKQMLYELAPALECNRGFDMGCGETSDDQDCMGRFANTPDGPPKSNLLERVRNAGLELHAFTFRNEMMFMALNFQASVHTELDFFAGPAPGGLAIDGVMVDCPETVMDWRQAARRIFLNNPSTMNEELEKTESSAGSVMGTLIVLLAGAAAIVSFLYWKALQRIKKLNFQRLPRDSSS